MHGYLLEHHSDMSNATLSMIENYAKLNKMIGYKHGAMFSLHGGIAIISNNLFAFNGIASKTYIAGNPDSIYLLKDKTVSLPYENYQHWRSQ